MFLKDALHFWYDLDENLQNFGLPACPSVRPSVFMRVLYNRWTHLMRTEMLEIFLSLSEHSNSNQNRTAIPDTLHEDLHAFLLISRA
jgi:hypothetical protein